MNQPGRPIPYDEYYAKRRQGPPNGKTEMEYGPVSILGLGMPT